MPFSDGKEGNLPLGEIRKELRSGKGLTGRCMGALGEGRGREGKELFEDLYEG